MRTYRLENDLLGELKVPNEAYYGIQTQRAIQNFPVLGEKKISDYPSMIVSLVEIKKAASKANYEVKRLPENIHNLINEACDTILKQKMYNEFPIHRFHGGGGTSANMNANEVIANLANEFTNNLKGSYTPVHPNEHVNLNQSTNDVYPSACHLAIIKEWDGLKKVLENFIESIDNKTKELNEQPKISRTCLQDAVVITYKDFFSGYREVISRCLKRISESVDKLKTISIGGTIVGDKSTVPDGYIESFTKAINEICSEPEIDISKNLFDSAQNPDEMVNVSSQLNILARSLIKIAKDIRLMSSGPQTGFGEITIPEKQPGSSIMPGKVNPVIPEFLIQLCFQVIGLDHTIHSSIDHGELELNIYESSIAFNIMDQINLLTSGIETFNINCFKNIKTNEIKNKGNIHTIIPLITDLMKLKGYKFATEVFKKSKGDINVIINHLETEE